MKAVLVFCLLLQGCVGLQVNIVGSDSAAQYCRGVKFETMDKGRVSDYEIECKSRKAAGQSTEGCQQ